MGENKNKEVGVGRGSGEWLDPIVLDALKYVGLTGFSVNELLAWLMEDDESFVLTRRTVSVALMRLAREGRVERVSLASRGREPRWRLTKKEQKLMSIVRVSKKGFRSADKPEGAGGMTRKARMTRDALVKRLLDEGDGGAHLFELRRATDSAAGAWMLSWHGPVGQFGLYLIYPEGQVR